MKKFISVFGLLLLLGFGCSSGSSTSYSKNCSSLEPENPYGSGSGHSAGFEWGESGKTCSGNSQSFIEGCRAYERQEASYQDCLSR